MELFSKSTESIMRYKSSKPNMRLLIMLCPLLLTIQPVSVLAQSPERPAWLKWFASGEWITGELTEFANVQGHLRLSKVAIRVSNLHPVDRKAALGSERAGTCWEADAQLKEPGDKLTPLTMRFYKAGLIFVGGFRGVELTEEAIVFSTPSDPFGEAPAGQIVFGYAMQPHKILLTYRDQAREQHVADTMHNIAPGKGLARLEFSPDITDDTKFSEWAGKEKTLGHDYTLFGRISLRIDAKGHITGEKWFLNPTDPKNKKKSLVISGNLQDGHFTATLTRDNQPYASWEGTLNLKDGLLDITSHFRGAEQTFRYERIDIQGDDKSRQ